MALRGKGTFPGSHSASVTRMGPAFKLEPYPILFLLIYSYTFEGRERRTSRICRWEGSALLGEALIYTQL